MLAAANNIQWPNRDSLESSIRDNAILLTTLEFSQSRCF